MENYVKTKYNLIIIFFSMAIDGTIRKPLVRNAASASFPPNITVCVLPLHYRH